MFSFSFDVKRKTLMQIAVGLLFVIAVLAMGKFLGYGSSYEYMTDDNHNDEDIDEENMDEDASGNLTTDEDDDVLENFVSHENKHKRLSVSNLL